MAVAASVLSQRDLWWALGMIFVTVGNSKDKFQRLLDSVDQHAGDGLFERETVIIQSGHDRDFRPRHCKVVDFFPLEEFVRLINDATLIICHGGAGTLYHAFHAGKVPIAMPRRKKYKEILTDNEIGLVQALASEGRIIPVYEPEDLPQAIVEARRRPTQPFPPTPVRMLNLVDKAIQELIGHRSND